MIDIDLGPKKDLGRTVREVEVPSVWSDRPVQLPTRRAVMPKQHERVSSLYDSIVDYRTPVNNNYPASNHTSGYSSGMSWSDRYNSLRDQAESNGRRYGLL